MKLIEELGLAFAAMKVFDCIDSKTELNREQLTQVQLQNENMRLRNQIAQMQAQQTIEVQEELSEPDEYDLEVMKNFAAIRMAISKKD